MEEWSGNGPGVQNRGFPGFLHFPHQPVMICDLAMLGSADGAKSEPTIQKRVKEMLSPVLYGKGVRRVRLIQTHTSWVFIAGDFAYKVKKPVNFGFLDYTTLSARRFFCAEELRLNRLLSPDMYLDVLPITEERGKLRIGGTGRVIDYCIKMRALPQSALMTERLRKHQVGFIHIDEIARRISDFHRRAERGRQVGQYGSSEIIKVNWDENFAQTVDFLGKTISQNEFGEIKEVVERFIAKQRELFRCRRQGGFVRRCHGDLHSKNIFITDRVYIFDCIEFNPRFSCCDVASEVAFMAMDLDYFNRHDLANFFIERYLVYSGDEGVLPVLNFYRCYRAYVRGKVTGFQLNDPTISRQAKRRAKDVARLYFQLAARYARLIEERPWLVVVMGLPGTGKSYLARKFAARRLAVHLMSDSIRKQLLGIPVDEHRFDGYGQGIYTAAISQKTYEEMLYRARVFLSGGQSVILDATFLSEETRNRCRELGEKLGVPVLFVWADCPEETVVRRLRRRRTAQSLSDAKITVYRAMRERFKPPASSRDLLRIDTREPVSKTLERIERALLHL